MALILLHEYKEANRRAEVHKWANGLAHEVHQYEDDVRVSDKTFNTEQAAEDFAEDWVLAVRDTKKKTKKSASE